MSDIFYYCTIPVGTLEDIGFYLHYPTGMDIFEWTHKNMKYPFSVQPSSSANMYTHLFPSSEEDAVRIKEHFTDYKIFTESSSWNSPNTPAYYMTTEDYHNKKGYYYNQGSIVYSDLCVIEDIVAFKIEHGITPYYSGKTLSEFMNMDPPHDWNPWYHREDIARSLEKNDD